MIDTNVLSERSYSSDFESAHEFENEKTPFVETKYYKVLNGNTFLTNRGKIDSLLIKAPKKQKKKMKASKRFKIFGSMRKSVDERTMKNDEKHKTIYRSAYDFSHLGQSSKGVLKEFQKIDLKPENHESIYYERVVNKQLSSNDTILNTTESDTSNTDITGSNSLSTQSGKGEVEIFDDRLKSQSRENSPAVRLSNRRIDQHYYSSLFVQNPACTKRYNINNTTCETQQFQKFEHSIPQRHNGLHLTNHHLDTQQKCHTTNRFDRGIKVRSIDQAQYNDDRESNISEISMNSPIEASNKKHVLHKLINSCYHSEDRDTSAFLCNLPSLNPTVELDLNLSSSTDNSQDSESSVVEIELEQLNLIENVSTLSSNSEYTETVESEENEEEAEEEAEEEEEEEAEEEAEEEEEAEDEYKCQQNQYAKSNISHKKSKVFFQTKKILLLIQGKISACFVPENVSPPTSSYYT